MALDMYIYAEKYTGGGYNHVRMAAEADPTGEAAQDVKLFEAATELIGLDVGEFPDMHSAYVKVQVGYWRKANAIHNWFVENVQGGRDECQLSYVEREQLEELLELVTQIRGEITVEDLQEVKGLFGTYSWSDTVEFSEVAKTLIQAELPPTGGFFFGSTELDYSYVVDLDNTIQQLTTLLRATEDNKYGIEFYYQSSW